MFLLISHVRYHHGGEYLKTVGELASDEEANEFVLANIDDFHQREDGGGTDFLKVEEGDYVKQGDKFYVSLDSFDLEGYPFVSEEVRDQLEPY